MKVLLINPKNCGYPISVGYIGAILKEEGHKVEIIDYTFVNNLEKEIRKIDPDIVGVSFPTVKFTEVKQISDLCKKIDKNIKVIVGGPHPTAMPKETASIDNIDFVVYGEGELTAAELVNNIESGNKNFKNINGIAFKENDEIVVTQPRELIKNLDEIPPPHEVLPIEKYSVNKLICSHILTSRGCPFSCAFCPTHITFGRKVRCHSIDRAIQELDYLYNKRGVKILRFIDPTFDFNRYRTIDLCKRIVEEKLKIKWVCTARIDLIDEEVLKWMARAGCFRVECGLESGNQEMQKTMGKYINLKKALKNSKIFKKYGIELLFFFIIGLPGETHQTALETINFSIKSKCEHALFSLATPYPGTRLYHWAEKNNYIVHKNWDSYTKGVPLIERPGLSGKDMVKLRRLAYIKFYFRHSKILEVIKNTRSFEIVSKFKSLYFYKDLKEKLGF